MPIGHQVSRIIIIYPINSLNCDIRLTVLVSNISESTPGLLLWRHNEWDSASNHRRLYCLLHRMLRHRSKKTSKLRVTGLCEGNSPVTVEFPAQRASNAEMFPFDDVIMLNSCLSRSLFPAIETPRIGAALPQYLRRAKNTTLSWWVYSNTLWYSF